MFELLEPNATLPVRATKGSAGYDLTCTSFEWNEAKTIITYRTGVRLKDVPEGYFGALFPRSSVTRTHLRLANGVGVIDSDYTGEILVIFDVPMSANMIISPGNIDHYKVGDKIAQLVFIPYMVDDVVTPTEEREGGFGSTNKPKKVK